MSHFTKLSTSLAATLAVAMPVHAQDRSAVSSADLDAAVASLPTGNHVALREFLGTSPVQQVAGRMGISPADLAARVATLDQATLDRLAQRAGSQDPILAGGADSIVISTTAIIIGLLLIILLVS